MVEMAFSGNELKNHEHDDISVLKNSEDLYADTVPEKTGKGVWNKVKNIVGIGKIVEMTSRTTENEFNALEATPMQRVKVCQSLFNTDDPKFSEWLRLAFKSSKMNENGDARIFFALLGMDKGILTTSFFDTVEGEKAQVLRTFFNEKHMYRENIRKLLNKYFSGQTTWTNDSVRGVNEFWDTEVLNSNKVMIQIKEMKKNNVALDMHDARDFGISNSIGEENYSLAA